MNRDQILAILYDMALAIGSEVQLRPLLTRTLQKLLFHTSFPCGIIFLDLPGAIGADLDGDIIEASPEVVIGDYELTDLVGQKMILPKSIVAGKASLITEPALLKSFPGGKTYEVALRLPIDSNGVVFLLATSMPRTELPLTEIFQPVMDVLGKAILLCRRNDEYIEKEIVQQSEVKYRTLIQKIQAGVVVYDPDKRTLLSNSAAQSLLGLSDDQISGKVPIDTDWYFLKEDGSRMSKDEYPLNKLVSEKSTLRDYVVGIHKPANQNLVWIQVNGDPVMDSNGNLEQIIITFVDIGGRKLAEEEIRKFNDELEQRVADRTSRLEEANREMEAFSYSVSHDLRAPLRHIDGFVGLLRQDNLPQLDENGKHYLEIISNSVKKMNTLIDDILSFSRAGRAEMKTREVDFTKIIYEIIDELKPDLNQRKIEWNISPLPMMQADASMIRQVFYNLILNAVKFTKPCPVANIEIGIVPAHQGEKEIVFFIRDNGVGFNMNYADQLFGVFKRLHSESQFEGTGIGLANVKRIISRHGGRVWAESEEGKGATFFFSLPISSHK